MEGHSSCNEQKLRKGRWSPEEDEKLRRYITVHGIYCWSSMALAAGLQRSGKSCRLRWSNYLRPGLKKEPFSQKEKNLIIELHARLGNRWSQIAAHLPGRIDNEIKNIWNLCLKKKLNQNGVDPVTHKPFSEVENNNNGEEINITNSAPANTVSSCHDMAVPGELDLLKAAEETSQPYQLECEGSSSNNNNNKSFFLDTFETSTYGFYKGWHEKVKSPDKSSSDDEQPDKSGSVCDVAPSQAGCPASPVRKEQIPQRQRRKLPEQFAGRTKKIRVHSKSSSVPSKDTSYPEQERSEDNSEYPSRPLPLAVETQRKLASDSNTSRRFHGANLSTECHSGGQDKDKHDRTTLDGLDVSDSSNSELRWPLRRKQDDLYVNAPLSSLPTTGFRAEYFVELRFSGCTTYEQAWLGRQRIGSLRVIDFSHSNLKNLPDFSEAHQARSLILQGCRNLANVSCIQHLAKLEHLNLKGCAKLTVIPSMMHLKLLSSVDLSHCRNLKRLPRSMGCLSGLTSMNLRNCKRLENLPVSTLRVQSLQSLDISGCSNLMKRASPAGKEEKISSWEPELTRKSSFEGENSAATLSCQDLQEQMPALEFYMDMSVEAIHLAGTFGDIEELVVDSWFHQTSSLQKRAHLKDTMCFLGEVKRSIPRTMECMRSARTCRASLQERLTHVASSFIEAQGECFELDAQLTTLSDEEAKLDAEIQALISRKEELMN